MAKRFKFPAEWQSTTASNIFAYKKFTPLFFDNLTLVLRHGRYSELTPHWHGENHNIQVTKIFYITEGKAHLIVENKHYDLVPGNFYIIPEKHTHSFYIDEGGFLKKYWFHVNIRIGDSGYFGVVNMPVCIKAQGNETAITVCKNLSDHLLAMEKYKNTNEIPIPMLFEEKALLAKLAGYISECAQQQNHTPDTNPGKKFGIILDYIDKNITDNIKIETLAKLVNMHPNYFVSKFKKIYSLTPHQMILEKKIEKAKELLVSSSLSVSHIASYLGYNDIYYFSRQFKKIVGISPNQYKKEISQ